MRKKYLIILIWTCTMLPYNAWYPVMQYNTKKQRYIGVMQQADNMLSLWAYDISTKKSEKLLHSRYLPTQVKLLPSGNAFSFIDQGRIRIKEFIKRSTQSLDIYEPLYNLLSCNWISDTKAVIVAQQYGTLAIFAVQKNGDMKTIVQKSKIDCMYPQKSENSLFYITRSHTDKACSIIKLPGYQLEKYDTEETIFKTQQTIAFLQMQSASEGFFIQYPSEVDLEQQTVKLSYSKIIRNSYNIWHTNQLFSFEIPIQLLFGENALHESIFPLLPKRYDSLIYYVSAHETEYLNVYCYNIDTNTNTQLTSLFHFHLTTPLLLDSMLYCGAVLQQPCNTPYLYTIACF